ncbi:MAG: histidine kinase [Bacteroidota bacterium]
MTAIASSALSIHKLEQRLLQQRDDRQRVILIDQLTNYYAYTNVKKAQALLTEQQRLLQQWDYPDIKLNYHLKTAIVENQLYNYYLAEIHFLQAIELLDERGTTIQQVEALIDYAGTCMNLGKMESGMNFLQKAEKKLQIFPDQRMQARLLCRKAYVNLHYSSYSKALELLLESDKHINQIPNKLDVKDYYFLTLVYSGLGKIYEHNDEQELSVKSYLKVVNMCETMDMRSRLSWHYLNVGIGYMSLEDEESAEIYFKKAINVTDDVSQHARASAYANLGHCYFQQKYYDEALELYNRADYLYKEQSPKDFYNFSILDSWKAQLLSELGQRQKALKYFESAYAYAEIIEDYRQLSEVCKGLATFYADSGDYKVAYEYLAEHDKMDMLHSDQVQKRQRLELEVKYEAEKKQREAEMSQLRATQLQMKALRAQMNPHFLFNALNSIQNYITSNEVTFAAKYLSKFAKLMRRSLEYSEQEIISLEEEVEFLRNYMDINAKLRFGDRLDYAIYVDDELEEDIIGVPTMIIQPYVENSIEHGLRPKEDGLIEIRFELCEEDDDMILCIIEDNGVGRKRASELQQASIKHQGHKSMGTKITETRLQLLHQGDEADFEFVKIIDLEDEEDKTPLGTRVEVRIPILDLQVK